MGGKYCKLTGRLPLCTKGGEAKLSSPPHLSPPPYTTGIFFLKKCGVPDACGTSPISSQRIQNWGVGGGSRRCPTGYHLGCNKAKGASAELAGEKACFPTISIDLQNLHAWGGWGGDGKGASSAEAAKATVQREGIVGKDKLRVNSRGFAAPKL